MSRVLPAGGGTLGTRRNRPRRACLAGAQVSKPEEELLLQLLLPAGFPRRSNIWTVATRSLTNIAPPGRARGAERARYTLPVVGVSRVRRRGRSTALH